MSAASSIVKVKAEDGSDAVVYKLHENALSVSFECPEFIGVDTQRAEPVYRKIDGVSESSTNDPRQGASWLKGFVKWDRSMHWWFDPTDGRGYFHAAGSAGLRELHEFMLRIYSECVEIMEAAGTEVLPE